MFKQFKPNSEFSRNVIILMSGTALSQALPVIAAPILTRIYTPEDFGLFAFYFAIISMLSVIVTLRYELAIVLPRRRSHAIQLVFISWGITTAISLIVTLLIWLFNAQLIEVIANPNLSDWLFFIPASIFVAGIYQSLYYWSNREKFYKRMSGSRVIQSSGMVTMQCVLGWATQLGGTGLILGRFLGQVLSVVFLLKYFLKDQTAKFKPQKKKQIVLARRYIDFPKFMVPGHLMNSFSLLAPNIFLNLFYSSVSAGYFMLVQRVIASPMAILGSAFSDVFRKEADAQIKKHGDCKVLFLATLKKLTLLSIIPFSIFFIIAPDFFIFAFGPNWEMAGDFARLLTPMFFLQFLARPLSIMYIVREKQKSYFKIQSILAVFVFTSFLVDSIEITMILISVSFSFVYFIMLFKSYLFSRGI